MASRTKMCPRRPSLVAKSEEEEKGNEEGEESSASGERGELCWKSGGVSWALVSLPEWQELKKWKRALVYLCSSFFFQLYYWEGLQDFPAPY